MTCECYEKNSMQIWDGLFCGHNCKVIRHNDRNRNSKGEKGGISDATSLAGDVAGKLPRDLIFV
jgi:hypothetical protein